MSAFGKCHNRPRSDASIPLGEVDHEAAARAIFNAKEADALNNAAWDRRQAQANECVEYPEPAGPRWQSKPLDGISTAPVTIETDGTLRHLFKVPQVDGEHASIMETASGRHWARAEAVLQSICRDETGQFETEEERKKRIAKDERLKEQGSIICDALESVGYVGFRCDAWQLVSFGVHSHEVTEIPAFRRICLNPYVAHRLRMKYLNWLNYFAQGKESALRFWTFTTGKRCLIHRLEARLEWLHKRLSQLNAQKFMVKAGVRIIFRATEFGTLETDAPDLPENDGDTGGSMEGTGAGRWYHPHAHCIVWMKNGPLRPWRWEELLRRVWAFWHHHWDEGKRVRNMREAVKYVSKPGDMVTLAEECPAELRRLAEVVFRKKLVQPMDELALQMRAAKIPGLRPKLRWKDDVLRWVLEANTDRNPLAVGSRGSGLYGSDGVKADFRASGDDCSVPVPTELTNSAAERYLKRNYYGVKPGDVQVCRVVARCSPAFNSAGLKEPRVVVIGSYFDKAAVLAHPLVRRMVSATRAAYVEGIRLRAASLLGSDIRVHTGTPTVCVPDPGPPEFEPSEAHDPEFLAELAEIAGRN